MKWFRKIIILVLVTMILSSCTNQLTQNLAKLSNEKDCPDAEIEWVDLLMINGIKYHYNYPDSDDEPNVKVEKGNPLGEISYTIAGNACSNHKMKNGDAAFIDVGTTIYEVKGYPSSLLVSANDKVYVADQNDDAITIGELYEIKGLVKNIHFESTEDGRRIHTFSSSAQEKFIEEWLTLKLGDPNDFIKGNYFEGTRVFIEIELNNGVSFRQLYWADTNTFHLGAYGNDTVEMLIDEELVAMRQ